MKELLTSFALLTYFSIEKSLSQVNSVRNPQKKIFNFSRVLGQVDFSKIFVVEETCITDMESSLNFAAEKFFKRIQMNEENFI